MSAKTEIEITDSVSRFIQTPKNTEQCDNCHKWVKESKIEIVGELFLCDECRLRERDIANA